MSVGTPLPHDSARGHVSGQARYLDDQPLPAGTLHLAFGLSPVARGRLDALDLDTVRAAPGVVAVLSAADLDPMPDCSPSAHDEPLLAVDRVHYAGQPLFLVAADSHLAARRAARLGRPAITEEAPILTIDQALAADSRFEAGPVVWQRGDPGPALAAATHLVEGAIEIGGQEHFYLEGQAAAVLPLDDGGMHVLCSSQHPTEIQHKVAEALHLGMHDVRVEMRRMGGGFGGKESQGNALAVACAVMARHTGRPCKMRYDRDDDMTITGKRHDARILYRAGADAEGRITGIAFTHLIRCGWSMDLSLPVADRAMLHADNAYQLPAVRIESHRLKTNTQSATAYRGFGGPQGVLGIERVMDHLAHATGIAPAELRRRNYYPEMHGGAVCTGAGAVTALEPTIVDHAVDLASRGAEAALPQAAAGTGGLPPPAPPEDISASKKPASAPARGVTPYGMEVEDFILRGMTARLERTSRYAERGAEIAAWNARSPILKRGIALSPVKFGISFTLTHLNQAGALVHVYQDGSVALNHGGTEMGQGLHAKVSAVAAARFGLPPGRIRITATDTSKVPNTSATAASSGADLNGMAVRNACDTIRVRMAEFLARGAGVDAREVRFAEGRVQLGPRSIPWEEAVAAAYQGRISLSATGFYATPKIEWDRIAGRGRPFLYFAYGVAVSEVALDTLTGENRILRADILHDCGSSLNPALDIGQIEGGYVQGAGWLTTEELVWDARGRLSTHAPSTYKIPACSDRPRQFDVALWDAPNREETIYRSKAVGEPPFMLGISAFLALSAACAACGPHYPALDAPATPERLLAAIARARGIAPGAAP